MVHSTMRDTTYVLCYNCGISNHISLVKQEVVKIADHLVRVYGVDEVMVWSCKDEAGCTLRSHQRDLSSRPFTSPPSQNSASPSPATLTNRIAETRVAEHIAQQNEVIFNLEKLAGDLRKTIAASVKEQKRLQLLADTLSDERQDTRDVIASLEHQVANLRYWNDSNQKLIKILKAQAVEKQVGPMPTPSPSPDLAPNEPTAGEAPFRDATPVGEAPIQWAIGATVGMKRTFTGVTDVFRVGKWRFAVQTMGDGSKLEAALRAVLKPEAEVEFYPVPHNEVCPECRLDPCYCDTEVE